MPLHTRNIAKQERHQPTISFSSATVCKYTNNQNQIDQQARVSRIDHDTIACTMKEEPKEYYPKICTISHHCAVLQNCSFHQWFTFPLKVQTEKSSFLANFDHGEVFFVAQREIVTVITLSRGLFWTHLEFAPWGGVCDLPTNADQHVCNEKIFIPWRFKIIKAMRWRGAHILATDIFTYAREEEDYTSWQCMIISMYAMKRTEHFGNIRSSINASDKEMVTLRPCMLTSTFK